MENYKESRNTYQRLIREYPESSFIQDARVQLLGLFYTDGKYNELIKEGKTIPEGSLSPIHMARVYLLIGDAYIQTGFPADALYFYMKAHEKAPSYEKESIAEKMNSSAGQLNSEDTRALLNVLKQKPDEVCMMYRLGLILYNTGKEGNARSALSEFISKCPGDKNMYDAKRLIGIIDQKVEVFKLETIGCALPLSGPYKIYGEKALKGIELALAKFSSKSGYTTIKIRVKDTGSEPEKVVNAIKELSNAKAAAIIGPLVEAKSAALEAQDRGIPMVALTQKDDVASQGEFIFRNFFSPSMQVKAIVSYAMGTLKLKKFAIIYPNENYGSIFMNLFWDEVVANGGRIVGVQHYNVSQTDFTDTVKKLVGLYYDVPGRKMNPETDEPEPVIDFEALFIPEAPKKAALIMPQLAYHDVENVYFFGTNLWHSQKLIELADRYVQGAIMVDGFFAENDSQEVKDFVSVFEETYGEKPGFIEAVSYDTAMMLFTLISKPDVGSRSDLMMEMRKLKDYMGVTGLTSFDDNGDVHKKFYLLRVKGEEFVQIEY